MSYDISWLVENHIISLVLEGDVATETIIDMSRDIIQYLDSSNKPLVHLLVDDSRVTSSFRQIKGVMEVAKALVEHPRLGWLIIHGSTNKTFQFLTYMISQISKLRHRRFPTLDEAIQFLQTVDVTLPSEI